MLEFLQLYFVCVSIFIFFHALNSRKRAIHSFGYALILNILPLSWMPYISMDIARLGGLPLAYLPIIASGLGLAITSQLEIIKSHISMAIIAIIFLCYTFLTSVLVFTSFSLNNIFYWMAWVLNFIIFFSTSSFFLKEELNTSNKVIKNVIWILFLGCIIGILRYFLGISQDSNFIPVMNRNGTVILILLFFPLVFYIRELKKISRQQLFLILFIFSICIILMQSRSGFIGFIIVIFIYHIKFTFKNILIIAIMAFVLFMSSVTGVADKIFSRLVNTTNTISFLIEDQDMNSSMSDYRRVQLMNFAIIVIKDNLLTGTGLGKNNYGIAFNKVVLNSSDTAKAHNFYLSYLAELGMIGFFLLLLFFQKVYSKLPPYNSKYKAFKVCFINLALMMTMNEYILLPEIWFLFGMIVGISGKINTNRNRI